MANKIEIDNDEFSKILENNYGNEFVLFNSSKYECKSKKVKILHNKCGFHFKEFPGKVISCELSCPKCDGRIAEQNKVFSEKLDAIWHGEYKLVGDYHGKGEKIQICHTGGCGKTYKTDAHSALKGRGCPYCLSERMSKALLSSGKLRGGRRKTQSEFESEVKALVGDEYIVLGKYKTEKDDITMFHKKCQKVITIKAGAFVNEGRRCKECSKESVRNKLVISKHEFEQRVLDKLGPEYIVTGEYVNANTNIELMHIKCGYKWEINPNGVLRNGTSCPLCGGRLKVTKDRFEKMLSEKFGNEYSIVKYNGFGNMGKFTHNICGITFDRRAYSLVRLGYGCPKCSERIGERLVRIELEKNAINYIKEYKIPECKNIKPLPFDFAIIQNNKLLGLIEFDGKQHFEPVDFFGGKKSFDECKRRDRIKNKYCKDNNIPLLRIPYTYSEDKAKNTVNDFLKEIGAIG